MSKRKRNLEADSSDGEMENIDMDALLDSEEEFSENEKKLLEKVRQKHRPENFDSEDEVMGFDEEQENDDDDDDNDDDNDDMEEKDSMASDIEGLENDFDLPNEKAWGKRKRDYYSTDYVDADYSSVTQKDIADAELEEQEARNLQKRLAEQLDEADFGLDLIISQDDEPELDKEGERIKTDLSKLSKRQKQELLEKESPEFMLIVTDFEDRVTEAKTVLAPFLDLVRKSNCQNCFATDFVKVKYDLLLHYCTNIAFYLMLKAKREPVASHPVIKRLAQYRKLLIQLEERQGNLLNLIEEILEANESGQPLYSIADSIEMSKKKVEKADMYNKSKKPKISDKKNKNELVFDEDENSNLSEKSGDEQDEENVDEMEGEKRAITYQIAKNKGLTPYRKKELRNPRVKHRNKYRKAIIRRRGAVREVRKETTKYGGEISGIKASVSKSIKLK